MRAKYIHLTWRSFWRRLWVGFPLVGPVTADWLFSFQKPHSQKQVFCPNTDLNKPQRLALLHLWCISATTFLSGMIKQMEKNTVQGPCFSCRGTLWAITKSNGVAYQPVLAKKKKMSKSPFVFTESIGPSPASNSTLNRVANWGAAQGLGTCDGDQSQMPGTAALERHKTRPCLPVSVSCEWNCWQRAGPQPPSSASASCCGCSCWLHSRRFETVGLSFFPALQGNQRDLSAV